MRLERRHITRDQILDAVDSFELVESYPDDKYLPSYLILGDSSWLSNQENDSMRCRVCAGTLRATRTDLPFKVTDRTIIIVKNLPVLQCEHCSEYLLEDPTMARVEEMLAGADKDAELEIIAFAA